MFVIKDLNENKFIGFNGKLVNEYPDCLRCKSIKQVKDLISSARNKNKDLNPQVFENYGYINEKIRQLI